MIPEVHILVTCRKPELIRASTMVFDTLRVGFPTANVRVYLNSIDSVPCCHEIRNKADLVNANVEAISDPVVHGDWIESVISKSDSDSIVFLDTDMALWSKCEDWTFSNPLAGRRIPEFQDDFTKCITRPRLHTSHLWVKPKEVLSAMKQWNDQFPLTPFYTPANLFRQMTLPFAVGSKVLNFFFDTTCLLYQAIGGESFKGEHLNAFDHLNCGTVSDLVAPHLKDMRLREAHFAIFENIQLLKGEWKTQDAYYRRKAVKL